MGEYLGGICIGVNCSRLGRIYVSGNCLEEFSKEGSEMQPSRRISGKLSLEEIFQRNARMKVSGEISVGDFTEGNVRVTVWENVREQVNTQTNTPRHAHEQLLTRYTISSAI